MLSILLAISPAALAQGFLENPADGGYESGVGVVSGWYCDAQVIEVQFDDGPMLPAAYGTSRTDTIRVCGDSDNGFGMLWNYNINGPGPHVVRVFADGVEFDSAIFEINTLGHEFIQGLELETELTTLEYDRNLRLKWQDGKQNFIIVESTEADITMEDLITVLRGQWSGSWLAPLSSGSVSMTFAESADGVLEVTDVVLSGTGCAAQAAEIFGEIDINDPMIDVVMADGSEVEFEFMVTDSVSVVGGVFYFGSGSCNDLDGLYYMLRN
jgi:hypothetical protein